MDTSTWWWARVTTYMHSIFNNPRTAALFATASLALSAQQQPAPQFDTAAVERGRAAFGAACGFCHGGGARGGEGGPDLLRSALVLDDENGKQLGEFVKGGRPDKGMPAFPALPAPQAADIATFLHQQIASITRRSVQINIVTGDARAGEAFFNGTGKCGSCHSITGDLKGVGSKYDPLMLQEKAVMPRMQGGFGAPPSGVRPSVTVTLPSGEVPTGTLLHISEFDVSLRDGKGVTHTYARDGEAPKVEVKDPLQGHIDMLGQLTDKNMHDLTAYLVTLK